MSDVRFVPGERLTPKNAIDEADRGAEEWLWLAAENVAARRMRAGNDIV